MRTPATTKISQIIDYVLDKAKAAFPDHNRLRDPEDISNNDAIWLTKGFSILPAAGENTERELSCGKHYVQRDFEVLFTREIVGTTDNVESRDEVTKALLEDLNLLMQAIGSSPQVFVDSAQLAFDFRYVSDGGPRLITKEDAPYLFLEATLRVEYAETNTGGI